MYKDAPGFEALKGKILPLLPEKQAKGTPA